MNIENEINYHGPKKIEVFDLPISREIKSEPEQVDLIEKMSLFSDEERKLILRHNVGVQLTEGCNGKCPFCYQKIDFEVKKNLVKNQLSNFLKLMDKNLIKIGQFVFMINQTQWILVILLKFINL